MALFRRKADPDAPRLGIYIHIPFCVRKCDYCDFYSVPGRDGRMDEYLHALEVHIAESAPQAELYTVNTIYFGGGTPTFFGAERLARLLQIVRKQFNVSKDCEITVECNPDSADQDTLLTLKKAGVNRLSMGVQSAQDKELEEIGRVHSFAQATQAFQRARDAGFDNISLDLIYGLPDQTMESWKESVEALLKLNPEHLSCYGLKLEQGTPLYERREQEQMADDDTQADMYLWMVERLKNAGYGQYEISNFARPGRASRHNLKYWTMQEYLGFGPGAHSDFGGRRFAYARDLSAYIRGEEHLSESACPAPREREEERVMLALRTAQGLDLSTLGEDTREAEAVLEECARHGLAQGGNGRWRLTPQGFLVSNAVIVRVLEALSL